MSTRTAPQPALVRPCFAQDLEGVRLLLTHHALTGYTWLDEAALSLEATRALWTSIVSANLPFVVACPRSDLSRIVGLGYARAGLLGADSLCGSPEARVCVTPALMRHGIGLALLESVLDDLRTFGATHAFAAYGHTDPSPPSALLHRAGFTKAGLLHSAARKFGRAFDVIIQERPL